jgi:transposase InsO family protein
MWYLRGLDDSIISKHWIKDSDLHLSIDSNKNFVLTSTQSGSSFTASTSDINRITVLPTITAFNYPASASIRGTISHSPHQSYRITSTAAAQLWHERYGHASAQRLRLLGIAYSPGDCKFCILGKQSRSPFPSITSRVSDKLGRVYCDHCGPIAPISFGNAVYILALIDEHTRQSWIYCVPDKSSNTTLEILKRWKPIWSRIKLERVTTLKILRTDQAKEFTGINTVTPFLESSGVIHETTAAYSSASNGVVERLHRTLLNMARAMLLRANLPAPFWAEAVDTANKIRNRLPTRSLPNNISPHEAWFDVTPPTDHFRQFGCLAFARISDKVLPRGNKFSPRSIECCFLGYVGNKIYRLWNPLIKQIVISRDVVFQEDRFLDPSHFVNIPQSTIAFQTPFDNVLDDEDRNPNEFTNPIHPPLLQYRPNPSDTSSSSSTTPSQHTLMAPIPRPPFPDDPESDYDDDTPPSPPQRQPSPTSRQSSPTSRQPSPRRDTPLPPTPKFSCYFAFLYSWCQVGLTN